MLLYTHAGYIGFVPNKLTEVLIMSVKVYSTTSCPWCTVAKNYLKSKNVQFEEVDVNRSRSAAMEMISKSGQRGVPVLDINGNIIIGFDQMAIDNALKG